MTNRYPGTCRKCGNTVEAGAGECKKIGRRWAVAHTECVAQAFAGRPTLAQRIEEMNRQGEEMQRRAESTAITTTVCADSLNEGLAEANGRFFEIDKSRRGLLTIREVRLEKRGNRVRKQKIGGLVASGRPGEQLRTWTDEDAAALELMGADPMAATIRVGENTGICGCCAALLTDPLSVAAGIGPVCVKRLGTTQEYLARRRGTQPELEAMAAAADRVKEEPKATTPEVAARTIEDVAREELARHGAAADVIERIFPRQTIVDYSQPAPAGFTFEAPFSSRPIAQGSLF